MLVEISSEIEGIKDAMAKSMSMKYRLRSNYFPCSIADARGSKNNLQAALAVSFENLTQQVSRDKKKQKYLETVFLGVVGSDRNTGRYYQGTGGYSR